jgi:SAM-dependent methyltransferase
MAGVQRNSTRYTFHRTAYLCVAVEVRKWIDAVGGRLTCTINLYQTKYRRAKSWCNLVEKIRLKCETIEYLNFLAIRLEIKLKTPCVVCGQTEADPLYHGVIRTGEGRQYSSSEHTVSVCRCCGLARLEAGQVTMGDYQSGRYRATYNKDISSDSYFADHDDQEPDRLARIYTANLRNKSVLDLGCGAGSFLDFIRGLAKEVVAVEPDLNYQASLRERGYETFGTASDALGEYRGRIDTVTSFCVIEHTENPVSYLKQAYDLLTPGGYMYLETDNLDCLPMKLSCESFEKFFFRTAHSYYFDQSSLCRVAVDAGFVVTEKRFRQVYDLSNLLLWLRDGKPTGNGQLECFDQRINHSYREYLEQAGLADRIFLLLEKPRTETSISNLK